MIKYIVYWTLVKTFTVCPSGKIETHKKDCVKVFDEKESSLKFIRNLDFNTLEYNYIEEIKLDSIVPNNNI
jgi:hypothetical protein